MSRRPSSPRKVALARVALAVSVLLAAFAAPVAAREPSRPLPGYRPAFVTEVEVGRLQDCIWAASSMLLDKWTNGQTKVDRERLRQLAAAPAGGSSFEDVARAFARLGFTLAYTGDGRTTITWPQLLHRLAAGGGAVLLGDQHNMPRYYGRWDPKFWANRGVKDNHAVYVERYNPRTGMVWLMDPLAYGDWKGEWVPASALYRFVWKSNGGVVAAMTPAAQAAPFAGVKVHGATGVSATAFSVSATWSITSRRGWRFRGADVAMTARRIAPEAVSPGAVMVVAPRPLLAGKPTAADRAGVRTTARSLTATVALPSTPGIYEVSIGVTDRRFGHRVSAVGPVILYVPGARSAMIAAGSTSAVTDTAGVEPAVQAGERLPVSIAVTNAGTTSWIDAPAPSGVPIDATTRLHTRITGTWVPVAPAARGAAHDPALAPTVVNLGPASLAPGETLSLATTVAPPSHAGRWALVLQVTDDVGGSFATSGSAPSILFFDVVASEGLPGSAT